MILESKKVYYNAKIESANGDQKEVFKIINTVLNNKPEPILPSYNSIEELSNRFANFFVTKIENLRGDIIS